MTTAEFLLMVEQKIGQALAEVGGENPQYLGEFILQYAKTANFILKLDGIDTSLVFDPPNETITPQPIDDSHGTILACLTAASLIDDDLLNRLRSGEMGLAFRTGATEITTNQAAITLSATAKSLRALYERMRISYLSGEPIVASERLQ